jgi:methyl-accepting chemotaxis protein-1 (serine sensor receptor)
MNFRELSVRTRLSLGFGGLALLVLLASTLAIVSLADANAVFENYVNGIDARARLAEQVRSAVERRAIAARNLVLLTERSELESEKAAVAAAHRDVDRHLAELRQRVQGADVAPEARQLVADIAQIEQAYGPVALAIVELALQGRQEAAVAKMNQECRPLLARLLSRTEAYARLTQVRSQELVAEAEARYVQHRLLLLLACLAAITTALAAGWLITRSLTRALGAEPGQLGAAAQRVAAGDLAQPWPWSRRLPAACWPRWARCSAAWWTSCSRCARPPTRSPWAWARSPPATAT